MDHRTVILLFALLSAGCQSDAPSPASPERNVPENLAPTAASGPATKMNEHLERIENWLQANAPDLVGLLNPPATRDDLAAFESRHDVLLPPEVVQLYLIHNGESEESDGLFGGWKLLSLEKIRQEIELAGHEGRVPLFLSGGGDSYYVKSFDRTNPDHKLYEYWHEQPDDETVIADSLLLFLSDFGDKLDSGQYVVDPNTENPLKALLDKDDL
jgi:cell wall assembly regulator SMI1